MGGPGQQLANHLGVEGCTSVADSLQGFEELLDPHHSVLEQVADAVRV
jgi:hypothetical protein